MVGWRHARGLKSHLVAFEADMMAERRLTSSSNVKTNFLSIMKNDLICLCCAKHASVLRHLRDDPRFREASFPLVPIATHDMRWEDGIAYMQGRTTWLTFALPSDMPAAGIRLRYTFLNAKGTEPYLQIYWKSSDQAEFGNDFIYTSYPSCGDRADWHSNDIRTVGRTVGFWVCHPVQSVRIWPRCEIGAIKVHELTLLVPVEDNTRH
jgi:hypothetical protein